MSIDWPAVRSLEPIVVLQLHAAGIGNGDRRHHSPSLEATYRPPGPSLLQFEPTESAFKQEKLDCETGSHSLAAPPAQAPSSSYTLLPRRNAIIQAGAVMIDEGPQGAWLAVTLRVRKGKAVAEAEFDIDEKDFRTKIGSSRIVGFSNETGHVEVEWNAFPTSDPWREEERDGLRWMEDKLKMIELGREMSELWLPDPPLAPAKQVTIPGVGRPRVKQTQLYDFSLKQPLMPGDIWHDPGRDYTTRFAKIDWDVTKFGDRLPPTEQQLIRMHQRWREVYPLPGSATWLKAETACWEHFAPVLEFCDLFVALGDYLRRVMVTRNLLSGVEVDRIVDRARRAAKRGEGYRELRRKATGR